MTVMILLLLQGLLLYSLIFTLPFSFALWVNWGDGRRPITGWSWTTFIWTWAWSTNRFSCQI